MERATIYVAAALLATGAAATYATTPVIYTPPVIPQIGVSPYAQISNSKKMLLFISQAERLIYENDPGFAKMHINEAIRAASQLVPPSSSAKIAIIHRVVIIKVLDGTREHQVLIAQPDTITDPLAFSPDTLPAHKQKITSGEVHYISTNWDKAAILTRLNNTLRAIETGKPNAISPELNALHALLLKNNERQVSDRRAAQDNVALARALLQVEAFDAAKSALALSNAHLQKMMNKKDASPKRFEEIASIRNEMAEVSRIIERKEPSAFKALDAKLGKWWDALS